MKKHIHHICIQTNSYKESLNFYIDILGFKIIKETPNFHGRDYNTWIALENFMIELQTPKDEEVFNKFNIENEGVAHICFYVENIEEEYGLMVDKGYSKFKVKNGEVIYTVEDGKLFKLVSPEGTIIEFRDSEIE